MSICGMQPVIVDSQCADDDSVMEQIANPMSCVKVTTQSCSVIDDRSLQSDREER